VVRYSATRTRYSLNRAATVWPARPPGHSAGQGGGHGEPPSGPGAGCPVTLDTPPSLSGNSDCPADYAAAGASSVRQLKCGNSRAATRCYSCHSRQWPCCSGRNRGVSTVTLDRTELSPPSPSQVTTTWPGAVCHTAAVLQHLSHGCHNHFPTVLVKKRSNYHPVS
jgi:hypothetical protein